MEVLSKVASWFKRIFRKKKSNRSANISASATTVIAMRFGSAIMLATDGRLIATYYGLVLEYACEKIVNVDNRIAIGCSGDSMFIDMLVKTLPNNLNGKNFSVTQVVREVKGRMEGHFAEYETEIGVLVVGYEDNKSVMIKLTTAKTYPSSPMVVETRVDDDVRYETVGSGAEHVKRYLDKRRICKYPLETIDIKLRRKPLLKALKKAVIKDWGSGGRLQVICIDDEGGYDDYHEVQKARSGSCASKYQAVWTHDW